MSAHGPNIVVRHANDVTIVAFAPDVIDSAYIRTVGGELQDLVASVDPPHLVIDFEGVRFLSSSALGMLVALNEMMQERGGEIRIANVMPEVNGVFELTKLPKVMNIYATVKTALRNFGG